MHLAILTHEVLGLCPNTLVVVCGKKLRKRPFQEFEAWSGTHPASVVKPRLAAKDTKAAEFVGVVLWELEWCLILIL